MATYAQTNAPPGFVATMEVSKGCTRKCLLVGKLKDIFKTSLIHFQTWHGEILKQNPIALTEFRLNKPATPFAWRVGVSFWTLDTLYPIKVGVYLWDLWDQRTTCYSALASRPIGMWHQRRHTKNCITIYSLQSYPPKINSPSLKMMWKTESMLAIWKQVKEKYQAVLCCIAWCHFFPIILFNYDELSQNLQYRHCQGLVVIREHALIDDPAIISNYQHIETSVTWLS